MEKLAPDAEIRRLVASPEVRRLATTCSASDITSRVILELDACGGAQAARSAFSIRARQEWLRDGWREKCTTCPLRSWLIQPGAWLEHMPTA